MFFFANTIYIHIFVICAYNIYIYIHIHYTIFCYYVNRLNYFILLYHIILIFCFNILYTNILFMLYIMFQYIYAYDISTIIQKQLAESDGPLRQTPGICVEDFPNGKSSEAI